MAIFHFTVTQTKRSKGQSAIASAAVSYTHLDVYKRQPPDRPCPAPLSDFRLPPRSTGNRIARNYLTAARRIDEDAVSYTHLNIRHYIDDDESGRFFDRSAYSRMMDDVENRSEEHTSELQ